MGRGYPNIDQLVPKTIGTLRPADRISRDLVYLSRRALPGAMLIYGCSDAICRSAGDEEVTLQRFGAFIAADRLIRRLFPAR